MKKSLSIILTSMLTAAAALASNTVISPDGTYLFEQRDTCELFLDIYKASAQSEKSIDGHSKPTILFMFGGGFKQGVRNDEFYLPWFKMLTDSGYSVISIDYRLGLKGATKVGVAQVNALDNAIHIAVEDQIGRAHV